MPVRTVADWGGVHEWTVDASSALLKAGHSVTFIGSGELFESRVRATGADFISVDWGEWRSAIPSLLDDPLVAEADLIFAHAPHGRMVGMEISRVLGQELVVMVHGAYHDHMYSWSQHASAFLAASPSLVHFTQRFGRVEPWKVALVPNAAADWVFDEPLVPFDVKVSSGVARVVTASRLARDKLDQVPVVLNAVRTAARLRPDLKWHVDVYGDGPLKSVFAAKYSYGLRAVKGASVEFHGWIEPEEVPLRMQSAVIGIVAGMGGVRTVAAGALCIGVGARNTVGVQAGDNLRAGIWSNFGDHGIMRFEPSPIEQDLERFLAPEEYDGVVATARSVLERTNRQSRVDGMMFSALQC